MILRPSYKAEGYRYGTSVVKKYRDLRRIMIMKRRTGKKIKRYMSLAIAGMLMLSACGLKAEVPVDEDIPQYTE